MLCTYRELRQKAFLGTFVNFCLVLRVWSRVSPWHFLCFLCGKLRRRRIFEDVEKNGDIRGRGLPEEMGAHRGHFLEFFAPGKSGEIEGKEKMEAEFIFFPVERKGEKEGSEREPNNKCRKGLFGWTNLNFKFLNQDGGKKGVGGGRFFCSE